MSVIFGIINKRGGAVAIDSMNQMLSAINHRSVDGNNIWSNDNVSLGHCLLKIYPQQEFEKQPLSIQTCTITADARLDNREQLASLLKINNRPLRETTDPEIIILAYKQWGEECVNYLDGEFAFVIWDSKNRKLFAAVDKIGFRPLFYYDSPELFIFCSEIKGVVAAKPKPNYFNEDSLVEYFYRKGAPNNTFNQEIFSLCGGNVLSLKDERLTIRKYWNLTKTGTFSFKKDEEWYECAHELIYKAVEKRLNPNITTGITLSGGLDSTAIACILSDILKKKNKPLYAFSSVLPIDYQGNEKDERHYIEIVGKRCPNIVQTYVEAPGVGPFTDLEEAFKIEETFPNTFFYMDKALLEAANKMNVKSLFSGFGGDFWISWRADSVIYELINSGKLFKAASIMKMLSREEQKSLISIFKRNYLVKTPIAQNILNNILKKEKDSQKLEEELLKINMLTLDNKITKESYKTYADSIQAMLNNGRIGRITGMFVNRNSHFSCDSMTPLFDLDLMTFLADAPVHLHLKNGIRRSILREAMKPMIPAEIFHRRDKMPFSPDYKKRITIESELYINIPKSTKLAHTIISQQILNGLKKEKYIFK